MYNLILRTCEGTVVKVQDVITHRIEPEFRGAKNILINLIDGRLIRYADISAVSVW